MKRKLLLFTLLCAVTLLCVAICAGCGEKTVDLGAYFSQEEIDSWKQEGKEYKYTMNGGYYISFQGQLYPVDFNNGVIYWRVEPPKEILLVTMNELFTDASLKERCAYLGMYAETRLFQSDIHHRGFLLDGKRPAYGTVLYMDETDLRQVYVAYGNTPRMGFDDEIQLYRYNGERAEEIFVCGSLLLTDLNGVFHEELNTFRKVFAQTIEHGVAFDAYTKYTNLAYPSAIFEVYDNIWWQDGDITDLTLNIRSIKFAESYHISLHYLNENYQDFNCIVFASTKAIQEFYRDIHWALEYPDEARYRDIVMDEQGLVTQCFDKYFHGSTMGKDNSAQVSKIFYSMEEFTRFLAEQNIVDYENGTSLCFSREENGPAFDSILGYDANCYPTMYFSLYAVWREYHTVNLHTPEGVDEQIICMNTELVLPYMMQPGYEFEGWYADENYSGQPVTKLSYTDGITDVYAKFRKVDSYTLTFEPCDGETFDSISYVYGDAVTLPYAHKVFYVFKGWCVDAECKSEPITSVSTEFYGRMHLYPCFEPLKFTLTLIAGDQLVHIRVPYGENYTLPTYITESGFIGYFDENGVQYTDENGISLVPFTDGADIQLFPHYRED